MNRLVVIASAVVTGIVLVGVVGAARYRADARWMQHDPAIQLLIDRRTSREKYDAENRR
ncbi:hypothetical protein [Frigoribacterium sp. MCBA15_019]|uniref:hypothetical protein n=1 Tax=Frigoribacterium sp. MCBA15_019 TaxID=1898745 RepID=UPI0015A5EA74|nr:hypothetical protein [Frigoribacterium sp. MCBA15_019]